MVVAKSDVLFLAYLTNHSCSFQVLENAPLDKSFAVLLSILSKLRLQLVVPVQGRMDFSSVVQFVAVNALIYYIFDCV